MRTWFKIFLLGKWQCHYDMYFRIWKTDIDLCQVIWNPFFNDVTWRTGSRSLFGLIQNLRYQEEVGTEWSTKYHFFQPILGLSINYVVSVGGGKKLQILQNKKTTILRRHSLWTAPFVNDYFDRFLLSFTMWQGHENSYPIGLNSRHNFKQRPFKFHLAFWRTTYWLKFLFSDISFKAFLKHKFSIGLMSKGQLISEWLFGVFKFSKKQTKKFDEIPP